MFAAISVNHAVYRVGEQVEQIFVMDAAERPAMAPPVCEIQGQPGKNLLLASFWKSSVNKEDTDMSTQAQSKEDLGLGLGEKTTKRKLRIPHRVIVELDPDVEAVLGFMEENFRASKLVDIANAVKELAVPLWSRHQNEPNMYEKGFVSVSLRPDFDRTF